MAQKTKTNNKTNGPERPSGASSETFRKVKWIRRRRGFIAFFVFLSFISFILFFDYYWDLISRTLKQPSRETETTAGKFLKVSEKERNETFNNTRQLLDAGRVEEARQLILKYLQKEANAEGYYLAGLVYMRQGDVNSAYRNFKEAIRLKPDYYDAQQKLAEVFVTVGDLKSAQQTASLLVRKDGYIEDGLLLQSEIALAEGKLDDALKKVQSAVDASKGDVPEKSLIQLANLYAKKGELVQADQIIRKIDANKLDAAELLSLARYYMSIAQRDKAGAIIESALKRFPNSPEIQYYYGQQLFGQGSYREAIPYFQKVYALMPHSRITAYRYGQVLIAAGRLDEAKRHIDDTLSRNPGDILALSLKVRYELLMRKNAEAIKTLKQTVALVPDAPRPYTLLAELYWNEGILTVAEAYAQKALKHGEGTISPRIILGDIYMKKAQYQKSLEQYSKVLEKEPTNLIALAQTAEAYLNLGDVKKAEGIFEKIILHYPSVRLIQAKLDMVRKLQMGPKEVLAAAVKYYQQAPEDVRTVNGYVQALMLNNRTEDAIGVIKRAIKKDPKNAEYPVILGDIYLNQRNLSSAKEAFQQALQLAPRDVNVLINIGSRYEKNSLDKDAEALYLKAYALYPDNVWVVNHIAWYYTDTKGDIEKARPFVETLRINGEGAYEKDTVGWFFYKTKDYNSAEAYFREALQMDPDNNAIRAHLALALFQMNKSKEALVEAERATKKLPPGDLKQTLSSLMVKKKGEGK